MIMVAAGSTLTTELAQGSSPISGSSRASLTTFVCHRALNPSKRLVSITAVMRPVSGTVRLNMRFQLLGNDLGRVVAVRGGDLGSWITPSPITLGQNPNDVWILRHPVTGIAVPAVYHFRVSFRWTGSDNRTIFSTVRLSPNCWQPDMRPDLVVESIDVQPVAGNSSEDRYVALIENSGLTEARNVEVLFAGGGAGTDQTATIPRLRAHALHREAFIGPACTSSYAPTVTVDPDHDINDLDPSDNSLMATCPAQSSSPGQPTQSSGRPQLN